MAFGTLELNLRPLKLAFLVDPADKVALTEAIQINSFLWGGMFNPIIPVFRRLPPVWQERFHGHLTAHTLVTRHLDAFDPDYVITVGKTSPPKAGVGFREVISSSEILAEIKEDGTPKYGVGLNEVLNHFEGQELKFVRHHSLSIRLPEWGSNYATFFAATFGSLPDQLADWFRKYYEGLPGLEWKPCSLETFPEFLDSENLFLRRLGNLYIERRWTNGFPRRDCIFFMDASKVVDIIDYWNLRAAGWNVIPAPKQAVTNESLQKIACEFIVEHCFPLRGNPEIINTATLLKSRCTTEAEMNAFWELLKRRNPENQDRFGIGFQTWHPPIWDEWARECNQAECSKLESQKSRQDLRDLEGARGFKVLSPPFASHYSGHDKPRFANEIDLRVYGDEEPSAEATPEAEQDLQRVFGLTGGEDFRFSRHGPIYLARYPDWSVHISVPKAEDFFRHWLTKRGWKAELSDKDYVAKQMLRQLGGIWGIHTLADEKTLNLLAKMESGRPLSAKAFRAELNKICANQPTTNADRLAKKLVDLRVVQLGLELQCPHCRQHSWHSMKDADYELGCPKCLQKFNLPSHTPNELAWSYRSTGPFSLPDRAYGVYSVLLTLRFFAKTLDRATTPLLSFIAKKASLEMEADLALFFQESRYGQKKTDLIFAECKTNKEFNRKDADRMSDLAKYFPGAVLVFATLNKTLSKKEQTVLRPVANRGRRLWKTGHSFNPVLILTGTELFAEWGPSQAWRDAGGKHATFADYHRWPRGELMALCDATQQLYLDLPPQNDWGRRKRERKRMAQPPVSKASPNTPSADPPGQLGDTAGPSTSPAP
jgi:hypothetical protein